MYADDLVLISSSVSEMQIMIDVCTNELDSLDLQINVKKSTCIRIGKRFGSACFDLSTNGVLIPWSSTITYLGITIKSATKVQLDLKPCRAKFYRSFNSVYSKISRANEYLIVSLVNTYCSSVALYSLEALDLNKSLLRGLDKLLYRAFCKIFKTYDENIVNWCMYYMNTWPLRFEYLNRRIKFLTKISKSDNNLLITCYNVFGFAELCIIRSNMNIKHTGFFQVKKDLWNCFASSIGAS